MPKSRAPKSPLRGYYRAAIDADSPISIATRRWIASSRPPASCLRPQVCEPAPTRRFSAFSRSPACGWEAVHLDQEDVDPQQRLLTLRHTKLRRERHVPIHPTTQEALLDYQKYRRRIYPRANTPSFFLAEHGSRLKEETVRDTFVKLSRQTGLRGPCQSHGPRLQDLRHRFAVRTMLRWYRTGADVEAQLPKLSTYLGHVNVRSTYWYLTAVPELLQLAAARCWDNSSIQEPTP